MQLAEASPFSVTSPYALLMFDIIAHQLLCECCISVIIGPVTANTASALQPSPTTLLLQQQRKNIQILNKCST